MKLSRQSVVRMVGLLLTFVVMLTSSGCGGPSGPAAAVQVGPAVEEVAPSVADVMEEVQASSSETAASEVSMPEPKDDEVEDVNSGEEPPEALPDGVEPTVDLGGATKPSTGTGDRLIASVYYATNSAIHLELYSFFMKTGKHELMHSWTSTSDCVPHGMEKLYTGNHKHWFSPDYSKVAAMSTVRDTGEIHAGWLDANGIFYDVSTETGLAGQGGFSDAVRHSPVGFCNDLFVFYDEYAEEYYNVPVQGVSATTLQHGNPLETYLIGKPGGSLRWCGVSDSIDGNLYVMDKVELSQTSTHGSWRSSVLYNSVTHEALDYIPSTTARETWSGVGSPDKKSIAFLSHIVGSKQAPEIFVTEIEGGEPRKIESGALFSDGSGTATVPIEARLGEKYCALLEWQ